jgi:hypothetical protein
MCFINSAEQAYLQKIEPCCTMKTMLCRKYSFQLTQISQGSTVLDAATSSIDFLWRDTCVSSLSWIGLFGKNEHISTNKTMICRKYYFQKLTQFSKGKYVLDAPALTHMVFFWEIHVFLQLSWTGLFERKWDFLQFENSDLQEVFLLKTSSILTRKQCARCCSF